MEWWTALKTVWAISASVLLSGMLIILWRSRGAFGWKRSLKKELSALKASADQESLPIQKGIEIIDDTCRRVFKSLSPDLRELQDLPQYLKAIAACFYPDSDCPEQQISIRSFLQSLEKSLKQFDYILQRPGFNKLRSINIRTIRKSHRWYLQLSGSFVYQWLATHLATFRWISRLRLLLFLDPLVWAVYLSRRLTTLILIKYLMVDLYLFLGKLALDAYNETDTFIEKEGERQIEETLAELEGLADRHVPEGDPRIQVIRDALVGFPTLLTTNPTFKQWKAAVGKAAAIISNTYFPDADDPLEEAALGPLLESARAWARKVSKGKEHFLAYRLYNLRLETLLKAKNLSDNLLPKSLQHIIKTTYKTYGWLKWPLKAYRLIRNFTPWKLSLEVGWIVSKKASLAYIYGNTFDMACEECDRVYRLSRELKAPSGMSRERKDLPRRLKDTKG